MPAAAPAPAANGANGSNGLATAPLAVGSCGERGASGDADEMPCERRVFRIRGLWFWNTSRLLAPCWL